ncbi:MAG: ChbG/HpnK family deacetylase [Chloroflexota bacterium]|nr:MAG: ChbG/HpnK family deacetylase [Chloroflexota bacterium]
MAKQLIVTADDFGLSPGVNTGIVTAHTTGIVTGTSLMVNMPFARDAMRLAADAPGLAVGLHLNLTSGVPLTRARHLIDGQGHFLSLPRVAAAVTFDARAVRDARVEWEAQAEAFLSMRSQVAAVDSHHHLHTHPRLLDAALTLARELGAPLRWPLDGCHLAASDWLDAKASLLTALTVLQRVRLRRKGVLSTDHFCGLYLMGERFTPANLQRVIEGLRTGYTELMCHPAQVDDELRRITSYAEPRAWEMAALTSPALRASLTASGVELATWNDLKERVA